MSNFIKMLTLDLQCSVQKVEAMQRDMESKQQMYSSLQRQLDGLQHDLQSKQVQIDQQQRLAAAAKQAEERHGQLYHTYMKRALVNLYCHQCLAVVYKQLRVERVTYVVVLAVHCYFKTAVHPVCTSNGIFVHTLIDEFAMVRCHADACNPSPIKMSPFVHPKRPSSLFINKNLILCSPWPQSQLPACISRLWPHSQHPAQTSQPIQRLMRQINQAQVMLLCC